MLARALETSAAATEWDGLAAAARLVVLTKKLSAAAA
jgi:hypothetical protein